ARDRREHGTPQRFPEKNLPALSRRGPDDNASPPREKRVGCPQRFHWAQPPRLSNSFYVSRPATIIVVSKLKPEAALQRIDVPARSNFFRRLSQVREQTKGPNA